MGSEFAVYNSLSLNISICVVHVMFVLSVVTAASFVQTEPTGSVCQGDRVEFTCTGSGVLSWVVDGTQFPSFLASVNSVGTNFTVEGATAVLTNIDNTTNPIMYTSTLAIPFVMDDVEIRCVDIGTPGETTLMPLSISMVQLTVDSQLTSANVSVTSTNPTCAGMYVVMATPVNGGDAVTTMSTSSPVEVTGLNFCASNYTFTVMVQYRAGGNGPSVTDNNVQGDRMNLPPVTGLMDVDGGLQWTPPDLEGDNLPNDCTSGYEISWNGGKFILDGGITSSVSVSELMDAGFPLCMSTDVRVAPIVPAFGDVERNVIQTTLLHMPQSLLPPQNLEGKFVFLPSGGLVATNWMSLPSGISEIFGPTYNCINNNTLTTVQCDSPSSHNFTVPNGTSLLITPFSFTVAADYGECHVESSETIDAVQVLHRVPISTPSSTSANVTLQLNTEVFEDFTPCNAIGQISSPSTNGTSVSVDPRIVPVTSQTSNISFTFTGLNEETLYGYSITISCCNRSIEIIYGKLNTNAGSQIQPESNISYAGAITVSVIIPSLFTFAIGLVIGAVITYCFTKRQQINDQIDVIEQPGPGPVYDEVSPTSVKTEKFEMGENTAYGPTAVRH